MNDLNSNTHFKLIEKIQLDFKSPLRILVGFLTFVLVMMLQSFFILRFFGNSVLDFLLQPLIIVSFFTSLSVTISVVNRLISHKKGVTVFLNKNEIIIDDGKVKNKILNKNLKADHIKGFKIKLQNTSGQTLIIPTHVNFYDDTGDINLSHMYNLKVNLGVVELVKTTMDIKNKTSHSEVVKFPQN